MESYLYIVLPLGLLIITALLMIFAVQIMKTHDKEHKTRQPKVNLTMDESFRDKE